MADNNKDKVQALKDRKANGEQLSPEEEKVIADADTAQREANK